MGWLSDRWVRGGRSPTVVYKGVMGIFNLGGIACMIGMVTLPTTASIATLCVYEVLAGLSSRDLRHSADLCGAAGGGPLGRRAEYGGWPGGRSWHRPLPASSSIGPDISAPPSDSRLRCRWSASSAGCWCYRRSSRSAGHGPRPRDRLDQGRVPGSRDLPGQPAARLPAMYWSMSSIMRPRPKLGQ